MHQLPFTALLNQLLAGPVNALLNAVHIHPAHPTAPIPDHVAMQVLVFAVLIVFFVVTRASLSVEKPGTLQHIISACCQAAGAKTIITADHNTWCLNGQDVGMVNFGYHAGGPSWAGEIASCRANIGWNTVQATGAGNGQLILVNLDDNVSATASTLDTVTVSGHNCVYNCYTQTTPSTPGIAITCNGVANTYGVRGYGNTTGVTHPLQISTAGPLPNAQIGQADTTAAPQFVDPTRTFQTWGQRVANVNGDGSLPTVAATTAWIFAHGSSTQIPAVLAWVRAGFRPTAAALRGASYSGDTLTMDAAGNAWAGGATPDIGAMSYYASQSPVPVINGGFRRRTDRRTPPRIDHRNRLWLDTSYRHKKAG